MSEAMKSNLSVKWDCGTGVAGFLNSFRAAAPYLQRQRTSVPRIFVVLLLLLSSPAHPQDTDMARQAKALAEFEARIEAQLSKQNTYPRRFFAGANSPDEVRNYLEPILNKIERLGALNYPAGAQGKLYGSVKVKFEISSDGLVYEVKILKSSGQEALDQATIKVIQMATPFPRFPEAVRKHADILIVARDFTFRTSGPPI